MHQTKWLPYYITANRKGQWNCRKHAYTVLTVIDNSLTWPQRCGISYQTIFVVNRTHSRLRNCWNHSWWPGVRSSCNGWKDDNFVQTLCLLIIVIFIFRNDSVSQVQWFSADPYLTDRFFQILVEILFTSNFAKFTISTDLLVPQNPVWTQLFWHSWTRDLFITDYSSCG